MEMVVVPLELQSQATDVMVEIMMKEISVQKNVEMGLM